MRSRAFAEWLIDSAGVLVPPRSRSRWEREWKAELFHRERTLIDEKAPGLSVAIRLVRPALGAFAHAGWLRIQNPGFDGMFQDLTFAVRTYLRSPGFAAAAVLTLGLGIAANIAVLAVIKGALLNPYPYGEADRLAVLVNRDAGRPGVDLPFAYADVEEVRRSEVMESVVAVDWDPFNLRLEDRTEWVGGGLVSVSVFATLGLEPIRGRAFLPGEDQPGAAPVVILGERLWRSTFGAREVVGETVWLDGTSYQVIGVAPSAMDIPGGAELWVPLKPSDEQRSRRSHWLQAYGRLAPETTWERARTTLEAVGSRVALAYPETNEGRTFLPIPLRQYRTGELRPAFIALMAAVGLLLLIVCANLASLTLARTAIRQSEFGVRQALGASRGRLVRQLLTESLVLAGLGGAVGLALGSWATGALGRLVRDQPAWFAPSVDASVVGFAIGLTLLSAVLFGVAPSISGAARGLQATVRSGRSSTRHARDALVFVEIAFSTVLLIAAGLLIRSLSQITSVDPGFDAERRMAGTIQLPETRYAEDEDVIRFVDRLLEATEARADVASAAVLTRMPFRSGTNNVMWSEEGQGETAFRENPWAELNSVTPGYFEAMAIEVRRGRALTETDRYESAEVVVISETFAREFFGSRDPIGARISFSPRPRYVEIVGVVEDTRHVGLDQAARYQIYAPFVQRPTSRLSLVAESRAEAGALAAGLREIVRDLDPDLAISGLTLVEDVVRESVWRLRLLTQVFWAFGIFAVLLAAVGIAGIVAQAVSRRTHEIGVRMALGARAADIMGLVGRRIGWVIAGGLGAGAAAALLLGRLAEGTLYGVHPQDPRTFVAVIAAFALVGAAAAVVPARRAIAIDPAEALRAD